MSAKDYAVTQNYGYDPSYPTADHFHKGIDYGCPMQTPVIVNGIQIGLSGNSGFVTGPHLHVGRWIGSVHTNPGVGNGFNFGDAIVTEINEDATNGKYVRIQGDGASWVYLHLFEQTCSVGQRLTEAVPQAAAPPTNETHVVLPASVDTWAVYHVGSGLRKGTADQIGTLLPSKYGGLTYLIKSWVGDYAVIIDTQSFGEVTLWVKNTDAQFNSGQPVVAPAPPPPPAPVVVPEPTPNPIPPAAPLLVRNSETYDLIKELDGYLTSNQAINRLNAQVKIADGTYFVFNKRFDTNDKTKLLAVNVTKTPGKPGAWINTADNNNTPEPEVKTEEAPAPDPLLLKPTEDSLYKVFAKSQKYIAKLDLQVYNLINDSIVGVYHKHDELWIEGVVKKDNITYARLQTEDPKDWLGVKVYDPGTQVANLESYEKVYNNQTSVTDRQVTRNVRIIDRLALSVAHAKKLILGFGAFFSKIKPEQSKTKN